MMHSVQVFGAAKAQGSKRAIPYTGKDGKQHAAVIESAGEDLHSWRYAVAEKVRTLGVPMIPSGPVELHITFYLPRPKSRKHDVHHSTRPDVDKLTRAVMDAMKTGGAYKDDGQVARKVVEKLFEVYPDAPVCALIGWEAMAR